MQLNTSLYLNKRNKEWSTEYDSLDTLNIFSKTTHSLQVKINLSIFIIKNLNYKIICICID